MRASYLWAFLILAAIGGWVLSGDFIVGGRQDGGTPPPGVEVAGGETAEAIRNGAAEEQPFRVRVRTVSAEPRTAELTVRGRTEARQRVTLRAQTAGLVEAFGVSKGDPVSAGDLVCRIETGSREAEVLQAEAAVAQAELDFDAATTLRERGHAAETRLRATRAGLDAASAALAAARLELVRTSILAPFDGVVADIPTERGALLGIGDPCAEIVARDPMRVVAQVSERDVGKLEAGMAGAARLVTGDVADGEIRYISPSADAATRTFRVELEVPNPDGRLRDGVTADIRIGLEAQQAHRFSPAVLTLDDSGRVGVRAVDSDDRIEFLPVEILSDERDNIWVTGLPEEVTIVVVGHHYVSDGQLVEPVVETAEAAR